jgi:hypothetical protein
MISIAGETVMNATHAVLLGQKAFGDTDFLSVSGKSPTCPTVVGSIVAGDFAPGTRFPTQVFEF